MNIIYLNTTEKKPSGGAKVIYNHSSIINNLKIKNLTSEILHLKKTKISKLKLSKSVKIIKHDNPSKFYSTARIFILQMTQVVEL